MQLAPSLHRLGSSSLVNSYLIEHAGAIAVIDAGLRGHWKDLLRELEAMGRSPMDIRALLLTHGDVDHLGFAERLRQEHGVPVFVGAADAAEARGEVSKPAAVRDRMRLAPMAKFLVYGLTHGGLREHPDQRGHTDRWDDDARRARRPGGYPAARPHPRLSRLPRAIA
jgi:glyoxylase-like metal-dependent hydrolase (beta-lactamase superfamily II)